MEKTTRVNYRDRKRRKTNNNYKALVLAILLAASASMIHTAGDIIDSAVDTFKYGREVSSYSQLINQNKSRTNDNLHYFIKHDELSENIKSLEIKDKDDFYHHLICVAENFSDELRNSNFEKLLKQLDLDNLSKENPIYPSNLDLISFLNEYGLYNENGTINFEAWRDYDKQVFSLENELRGGKGL